MKILVVSDYSTPTGGAEIYVLQLRSLLREAGHDVLLLSSSVGATAPSCRRDAAAIGRWTTARMRTPARSSRECRFGVSIAEVIDYLKKYQPPPA